MKTAQQIKEMLDSIEKEYSDLRLKIPSRERAKYLKLKEVYLYLGSCNPTEEALLRERERVSKLIESLTSEERFQIWMRSRTGKIIVKPRAVYEQEAEIPKYKNQLKTIDYILG